MQHVREIRLQLATSPFRLQGASACFESSSFKANTQKLDVNFKQLDIHTPRSTARGPFELWP
jgi:hypothetical protein